MFSKFHFLYAYLPNNLKIKLYAMANLLVGLPAFVVDLKTSVLAIL